jgi:predicted nucleic acid-binding Zn ribbon protein
MLSDKQFCSQACKDNYLSREKKQKKKGRIQMIILFGAMGVMIIFMMFLG